MHLSGLDFLSTYTYKLFDHVGIVYFDVFIFFVTKKWIST
jgi:hypothetical protein